MPAMRDAGFAVGAGVCLMTARALAADAPQSSRRKILPIFSLFTLIPTGNGLRL